MKSFFKTVLASALGALIAMSITSVLSILITIGIIAAMTSSASKQITVVEPNTILSLKLDRPVVDRASNNPMDRLEHFDFSGKGAAVGLNQLLRGIKAASTDTNIKGIYLDVSNLQAGIAAIEEIRNALLAFKESGKFIISYADGYGQGAYYLASVADKVYLNPIGNVDWHGLGAHLLFYKGALQKLGVDVEIFRHGKFKGAVEPFMYDKMSDENRAQILTYAGSIWNHWLTGVEQQRKISVQAQRNIVGGLLLQNAQSCVKYNFVDELKYKDLIIGELAQLTQQPADKPKLLGIADYANSVKSNNAKSKTKLAVLYAEGDIMMDGNNGIIGNDFASEIRKIRKDSSVKAVVFRINSPGGSALASDIIWREIDLLKQTKPVVVSMGNYAASGGYYIACPATKIVANPTTITGSIGVFSVLFNVDKAMKNKLGITSDVALTEPNADLGNIFRPLKPIEKIYLQNSVEDIYTTFVTHVANGRAMNFASVDAIAQGRVWSGIDAKRIKLVDEIGGLQTAIDLAADLASLIDYNVQEYPKEKGSIDFVIELFGTAKARLFASPMEQLRNNALVKSLQQQHGTVQARVPYEAEFNL
ncbi:signal peptide peptidase SppA [Bacteroidia bacterium]|nr:signal peptide peptidase SppA [Bacteroidia bacterium]